MVDLSTIDSPEQLAALLDGLADDDIISTVNQMGTEAVLDRVFEAMPRRFDAAKAGAQQARIQWNINTPDGPKTYSVTVGGGTCTAEPGSTDGADISLTVSLPVFLRLVSGTLNGTSAFMSGQLQLTGNVMTAMAMQSWFGM
jgi:putative sterol carrier protein